MRTTLAQLCAEPETVTEHALLQNSAWRQVKPVHAGKLHSQEQHTTAQLTLHFEHIACTCKAPKVPGSLPVHKDQLVEDTTFTVDKLIVIHCTRTGQVSIDCCWSWPL